MRAPSALVSLHFQQVRKLHHWSTAGGGTCASSMTVRDAQVPPGRMEDETGLLGTCSKFLTKLLAACAPIPQDKGSPQARAAHISRQGPSGPKRELEGLYSHGNFGQEEIS